jgi:hypothetical protein
MSRHRLVGASAPGPLASWGLFERQKGVYEDCQQQLGIYNIELFYDKSEILILSLCYKSKYFGIEIITQDPI